MKRRALRLRCLIVILFASVLIGCGGGGAGSGGSDPASAALTITTADILPGTLANSPYSTTLQAANGSGSLTWSIAPSSPYALFVNGLSVDPKTGVLSGTAMFNGTAGFTATVTDSASHSATKSFYLTAYQPLQTPAPESFIFQQYEPIWYQQIQVTGGVPPLNFSATGGPLPFGVTIDRETGVFRGSAMAMGNFYTTVTIRDSYGPKPELTSLPVTIQVGAPPFSIANSLPPKLFVNRPFSGRIIAVGGTPPYSFAMTSGGLPPGLGPIDTGTGQISGTPTTAGYYSFAMSATDSSSPPLSSNANFGFTVATPLGRNDSVATATAIDNGVFSASISPYIDPPDAAPLAADSDYYKLISVSGATVHVATGAQTVLYGVVLDTVIEILDPNGTRLASCNQPGGSSTNFTSACINDDLVDPPSTDSMLDFKVPGAPSTLTTFYVHVLDWRGDARPDMFYSLDVSGVTDPLKITSPATLTPAARGLSYAEQLSSANGTGTITWSLSGGTLPPGITLSPSGALTGPATTDGTYSFTVKATDAATPPLIVTAPEQIQVAEPVAILSSPTLPPACINQPYTFTEQSSGGVAPLFWGFIAAPWMGINLDSSTGIFSGISAVTGTFTGRIILSDATGHFATQTMSLTVNQCP
jgi:hypothetical protein